MFEHRLERLNPAAVAGNLHNIGVREPAPVCAVLPASSSAKYQVGLVSLIQSASDIAYCTLPKIGTLNDIRRALYASANASPTEQSTAY